MKAEKLKRNFWHSSEIECMLNLIKDVKIHGSTATTHYTFVQIANKMKRRGFPNKSPTQIRRKWFQMKSAYLCYKKGNVDRLLLIPEKFRNQIAQFVENDCRIARFTTLQASAVAPKHPSSVLIPPKTASYVPTTPKHPSSVQIPPKITLNAAPMSAQSTAHANQINRFSVEIDKPMETFAQRLMTRIKANNIALNNDFMVMQNALMQYEHKCQTIRDNNFCQFLSLCQNELY